MDGPRNARFGPFDADWFARAAAWTNGRLASYGVRWAPNNRLARVERLLAQVQRREVRPLWGNEDILARVAEAQRTALETHLIARCIGVMSQPLRERLEAMLGGEDLPALDHDTRPRDAQFELLVPTFLAMGDVPVSLAEPDWRIQLPVTGIAGVAAKRISSRPKLRKRLREGFKQLAGQELRGFVAINLDPFVQGVQIEGPDHDLSGQFDTSMGELDHNLSRLESPSERLRSWMMGVLGFATVCRWIPETDPPRSVIAPHYRVHWFAPTQEEQTRGGHFFEELFSKVEARLESLAGG